MLFRFAKKETRQNLQDRFNPDWCNCCLFYHKRTFLWRKKFTSWGCQWRFSLDASNYLPGLFFFLFANSNKSFLWSNKKVSIMHFTQNLALVTLKMKMICHNNQNESTPINTQQNQIIHKITINPKMFLITGYIFYTNKNISNTFFPNSRFN